MRLKKDITGVVRVSNLGLSLIAPKIKEHLLNLPDDDKYLRFYTPVNEGFIDRYLSGITLDARGDAVFVVYDDSGETVVGMCHVAVSGKGKNRSAELALSVSPTHRNRYIGMDMLERAILHCKTLGITKVFMYCLKANAPMQHMARRLNMTVVTDIDESIGSLELAEGKIPVEMSKALAVDTITMIDLGYRQMINTANALLSIAAKPFLYLPKE
jgi:RimJ/RimL family protein N-acetyltransferase